MTRSLGMEYDQSAHGLSMSMSAEFNLVKILGAVNGEIMSMR